MKRAAFVVAIAALSSCTVGPDYTTPGAELPARFLRAGDSSLFNAAAELWWLKLNDPLLAHYVQRGNAQNLSLAAAYERIRQAEAAVGQTGINASVGDSLSLSREWTETNGSASRTDTSRFGARLVLDMFGGQARAREGALANYEAAQFDVGVVRMALLSEVTDAYIRARYFQTAAEITQTTINGRRQLVGLVQQLRQAGAATQLDVEQARALLKSAEAALPSLEAGFEVNVIRLGALLSEPAARLMQEMGSGFKQPRPLGFEGAGVPANLLRNRPDLGVAERSLAAAVAQVGVATAELYPSVTLSGSVGFNNTDFGTRRSWGFGPQVNIPVLNRGLIDANRRVAVSRAKQAELSWRQAVRDAVEEVETALSNSYHLKRQVDAEEEALVYSKRVLELSRAGYRARETTLTELLDAEIRFANDRLGLAGSYREYALAWAQLQVAAGKGWSAPGFQNELELRKPKILRDPLALSRAYPYETVEDYVPAEPSEEGGAFGDAQ